MAAEFISSKTSVPCQYYKQLHTRNCSGCFFSLICLYENKKTLWIPDVRPSVCKHIRSLQPSNRCEPNNSLRLLVKYPLSVELQGFYRSQPVISAIVFLFFATSSLNIGESVMFFISKERNTDAKHRKLLFRGVLQVKKVRILFLSIFCSFAYMQIKKVLRANNK